MTVENEAKPSRARNLSAIHPAAGLALLLTLATVATVARLTVIRGLDGTFVVGWPGGVLGDLRMNAVLSALAAGAALGSSGAILQTLLRNPLASPFVLGVTSGAGSGVAIASLLAAWAGISAPVGSMLAIPAVIGAISALGAVLWLSKRNGQIDPITLILSGVIIGAIASAISTVSESMLPAERRGVLMSWLFGRIPDMPDPWSLTTCAVSAGALILAGVVWGRHLDGAALSDDEARSIGVPLATLRTSLFLACGITTAASVVLCGPIAFVGLLAPHCARAICGPRNQRLVLGSAITGAGLLVGADALRQWVDVGGGRLPIGAITAVIGGIAFLVLLRTTARGWSP